MTDQDRIAALEAEVARLTALVDDLQPAFDLLKAVSARASDDLEAERAANVLFVAQVTTLTEQRDLAAAEAERMRAMLARVRDVLRAEIQMPHTCSDCGWSVGGVPKGLHNYGCRVANAVDEARDLLASPSTAAQVLSERDEGVRRAALEAAAALIQGAFVTLESGDLLTSDVKALLASGIRALAEVKP